MLVKHIFVLCAVAANNVLAIANSQQTVSDIHAVTEKTEIAKNALENFNGGLTGALRVSRAV